MGLWVRGLGGSNFYVGCVGYMGQNTFYVGHHFKWVIIFTWVAWVKYTFPWVKLFLCGQNFLRGSNNFCSGLFLRVSLKKISIGAFTIIS